MWLEAFSNTRNKDDAKSVSYGVAGDVLFLMEIHWYLLS